MPVPNASLTPDETVQWSPSGPAALALTTSGALRVQRPRGPLVQAGTVNLVRNPLANTNVTGWLLVSTSVARLTTDTYKGATATVQVTPTGGSFWSARQDVIHGLVQGETYTYSIFLRGAGSSIGKKVRLFMTRVSGATQGGTVFTPDIVLTGTYQRVSLSTVVSESGVDVLRCGLYSPTSVADYPVNVPLLASHLQTELGPIATDFVDPDDPDVYWIAAANNSPSVRPDRFAEMPLGWLVEEATTNYDANPISAISAHHNNAYPYVTPTRITNAGLSHPTAGLIDTATRITISSAPTANDIVGTTVGTAATMGYSIAVGSSLTQQIWFRVSPKFIGKSLYAMLRKTDGTNEQTTKTVVGTGDWQYVDVSLTIGIADGTAAYFYFSAVDSMVGDANMVGEWIDFTATQLEQKSYATSLAVHTMGTGYSLGAANVTNRAAARMYIPIPFTTTAGSIYIRAITPRKPQDAGNPRLMRIGSFNAGTVSLGLTVSPNGLGTRAEFHNGSSYRQTGWIPLSENDVSHFYVGWDGQTVTHAEGGRVASISQQETLPSWSGGSLEFGQYTNGQYANTSFFAIAAFPRPLTEDEIAALEAIPTEELSYASIVGIGPQLGGLLLTHPDPGFAVLRTHGGS